MSLKHTEHLTRDELEAEVRRLRERVAALESGAAAAHETRALDMQIMDDWIKTDAAFRMILEQVPAILWAVDASLRFTLSVGAGLKNLGLHAGEIVGKSVYEYFQTEDPTVPVIQAHLLALAGQTAGWETQWQQRYFESHARPLRNAAGRVIGVIGVALDITERRRAADGLRDNELRYRTLAEASAVGIWQVTPDGATVYANPAMCTMLEIAGPEELRHTPYLTYFTPESQRIVVREHEGRSRGVRSHYEVELVGRRGRRRHVLISGAPIMDDCGKLQSIIGTFTDISARKLADRELYDSNERFYTLAKIAPVGISLCDATGNCFYANEQFCAFAGLPPEDVMGNSWARVVHPDDRDRLMAEWERSSRENLPFQVECRMLAPTGATRWILAAAAAARDTGGQIKYFVSTVTDITERRAGEEALRRTENLAATGRMAARIAHEINNPLAGIKNSFLLIKDAVRPEHPYFSYVGRIEREVDRIARIVGQMMDMYRPHQETPREFKLAEAITDVVGFLETAARDRGVVIALALPAAPRAVVLPESWLRQVLYNVLQNALEASPAGGVVRVEATLGKELQIRVSDQGGGIAADAAPHIFEPFFTTKQGSGNRSGLGLGLSTSRSLVQTMGGAITFEQHRAGGTTFQITLPLERHAQE